jgi:HD superfamily phosphohydrolase
VRRLADFPLKEKDFKKIESALISRVVSYMEDYSDKELEIASQLTPSSLERIQQTLENMVQIKKEELRASVLIRNAAARRPAGIINHIISERLKD